MALGQAEIENRNRLALNKFQRRPNQQYLPQTNEREVAEDPEQRRTLLSLAQARSRTQQSLTNQATSRAGQALGAAAGSYLLPGVGTIIGGWLGKRYGKWVVIGLLLLSLLISMFIVILLIAGVIAFCDSWTGAFAEFSDEWTPGDAGINVMCDALGS